MVNWSEVTQVKKYCFIFSHQASTINIFHMILECMITSFLYAEMWNACEGNKNCSELIRSSQVQKIFLPTSTFSSCLYTSSSKMFLEPGRTGMILISQICLNIPQVLIIGTLISWKFCTTYFTVHVHMHTHTTTATTTTLTQRLQSSMGNLFRSKMIMQIREAHKEGCGLFDLEYWRALGNFLLPYFMEN